jgi:hypothetical protein
VDGDSSQPSTASFRRSRRDAALCLTTNQPSTSSARKNSLRRARENTRVRRTIVTADLECGDFAGDERGATTMHLQQKNRWMARIRRIPPQWRTNDMFAAENGPFPVLTDEIKRRR